VSSPGERLQFKLSLAFPAVSATTERIWTSPHVRELYPVYLTTMHGVVRSAVGLMTAAIDACRMRPDDEVCERLIPYFEHHAPEEAGHDEWLLEDLEACGGDALAARLQVPSANVATLVGCQYYWLRHLHPVSLLGHMAVMEGYSPMEGFAARLQELTGYPPDAFRAVRRHEKLDIKHKRELYETIDALPLTAEHERIIGMSGLHTMQAAVDVFAQVLEAEPAVV
jgi:hypothetical protein